MLNPQTHCELVPENVLKQSSLQGFSSFSAYRAGGSAQYPIASVIAIAYPDIHASLAVSIATKVPFVWEKYLTHTF
jgi:hypothetical protein